MNAAPLETARWSQRRWFCGIALVFLAQVLFIFLAAEHRPPAPGVRSFTTTIALAVDPKSEQKLSELPALGDPTLFALPNPQGFSGAAWLTFAPLEHEFANWAPPEQWLEMDTSSLGRGFLEFVNTNAPSPLLVADLPLPSLARANRRATDAPLAPASEITLEGDLARRTLLRPIIPPRWPHSDILSNTVVQLLVDADGDSVSQTLLASCGSSEADRAALKLAGSARFQPLGKSGDFQGAPTITWGKMIFHWNTVLRTPTNSASAGSP
jgi:TonB family protein